MTTPTLRDAAMAAKEALDRITLYRSINGDDWCAREARPAADALRLALTAPEQSPADGGPAEALFLVHAGGDGYQAEIVPESRLDDAYLRTQWCSPDEGDAEDMREALVHFHDDDAWTHEDASGTGRRIKFSLVLEDGWIEVVRLPQSATPAAPTSGEPAYLCEPGAAQATRADLVANWPAQNRERMTQPLYAAPGATPPSAAQADDDLDEARCGPVSLASELRYRHENDMAHTPGYADSLLCRRTLAALTAAPEKLAPAPQQAALSDLRAMHDASAWPDGKPQQAAQGGERAAFEAWWFDPKTVDAIEDAPSVEKECWLAWSARAAQGGREGLTNEQVFKAAGEWSGREGDLMGLVRAIERACAEAWGVKLGITTPAGDSAASQGGSGGGA